MLRRALFVWGLGHLSIGDRRGWVLLALQPVALLLLGLITVQLIGGTLWLLVLPPLGALIALWLGQAVHAYERAVAHGAHPGGELQLAWLLPVAAAALTAFWLYGGRHGSPSATLEAYVRAWTADDARAAAALFSSPPTSEQLTAQWASQRAALHERIVEGLAMYGPISGLDPARPFASLRFGEPRSVAMGSGSVSVIVKLVRSERVETSILGFIPTASQQTVTVAPMLAIRLDLEPQAPPDWLPLTVFQSQHWTIAAIVEDPLVPS